MCFGFLAPGCAQSLAGSEAEAYVGAAVVEIWGLLNAKRGLGRLNIGNLRGWSQESIIWSNVIKRRRRKKIN